MSMTLTDDSSYMRAYTVSNRAITVIPYDLSVVVWKGFLAAKVRIAPDNRR